MGLFLVEKRGGKFDKFEEGLKYSNLYVGTLLNIIFRFNYICTGIDIKLSKKFELF